MDIAEIIAKFDNIEKRIADCEKQGADHERRIVITETSQAAMSNILLLQEDIQDLVGLLKQGRALFAFASLIGKCLGWVARSVREITYTVAFILALYYLIHKSDLATFTGLLSAFGR